MDRSLHFSRMAPESSLRELGTEVSIGLSSEEVRQRILENGPNSLKAKKETSKIEILIRQLKSIIVLLLFLAGSVSLFIGHTVEGAAVFIVLVVNTLIGFVTELKAVRSMEALKKMGLTSTTVFRDRHLQIVNAEELVRGDIVIFEAGDVVSADIRIIESSKIAADESILTGESLPVEKTIEPLSEEKVLAERRNILFKGTAITKGSGKGVVISTGMDTEVGKIVKITQEAHDESTPLEKRLDQLGRQLVWVSLAIALIIAGSGVFSGKDLTLMLEMAIALAIATIPEGLPIVATLALAKGMWHMARQNALINKLSAVETLGATSTIFTDKTGTLTENKMTARSFKTASQFHEEITTNWDQLNEELKKCLIIGALCNNSLIDEQGHWVGDPMEVALVTACQKLGVNPQDLRSTNPEVKEVAFDSETLMMATYHQDQDKGLWVAIKGAPEVVIARASFQLVQGEVQALSENEKEKWVNANREMAGDGLRVLGLAYKSAKTIEDDPYDNIVLCGLVGLMDPARKDIKAALENCFSAGITTIMVTGDQEGTAVKIARDIGLVTGEDINVIHGKDLPDPNEWDEEQKKHILKTRIFCRVSPEQKLSLVRFLQSQNQVVAMTGDGVNDAPALKQADIGIAMGLRGTQVAKEAADMVLGDDLFRTIVMAIKQGRVIYSNIQRFVVYLLSCNISEILIISLATLFGLPMPLTPLQILFLNLVTDVFPALALGMGEGDNSYLLVPPRKRNDDIITKRKWGLIFLYGVIITAAVLLAFFYTLKSTNDLKTALTVSFLTLGMAQVFHVFNMRLAHTSLVNNDITRNVHVWGAVILCFVLLLISVKIEALRGPLSLVDIGLNFWIIVFAASLAPLLVIMILSKLNLGIKG